MVTPLAPGGLQALRALRRAQQAMIAQNPSTITITRTRLTPQAGGLLPATSTVGPLLVRVYQGELRAQDVLGTVAPAGIQQRNTGWGLLAPWDADLAADPDVTDTFSVAGLGQFRIQEVYPQRFAGQAWGLRAALERVS